MTDKLPDDDGLRMLLQSQEQPGIFQQVDQAVSGATAVFFAAFLGVTCWPWIVFYDSPGWLLIGSTAVWWAFLIVVIRRFVRWRRARNLRAEQSEQWVGFPGG